MIHYFVRNIRFMAKDLAKNMVKSMVSSFGILFLISFLVLYLSLRESVKQYIGEKLFGSLSINDVVIDPKPAKGREVISTMASSENTISPGTVNAIRKMNDFTSVYTLTRLNFETKAQVELMGQKKKPHAPVFGIEPGFFAGKNPKWRQFTNRKVLPVILPKTALKLLNNYAAIKGMPQFTETMLIGFPGEIYIRTTDYTKPREEEKKYEIPAELHSFTSDLDFYGVLVPNDFIYAFTREHRIDIDVKKEPFSYIRIYARIRDTKKLPDLTKKLEAMNLLVESQSDISKKTNRALEVIDGLSLLIGSVILILTVLAIFNSYLIIVYNRSYGFSLKRVIGVSKFRIIFNFILEAGLIGGIYGFIGFYAGVYMTKYLSANISDWVPLLKGLVIEPAGTELLFKAVSLSVVISALSAFIPALFASNMSLFKAVKKAG